MSIWQPDLSAAPSCTPTMTSADASVARTCPGDPTKLFVDLTKAPSGERGRCYHWGAPSCMFDMNDVKAISFHVEMQNCKDVWAAPLWVTPHPWVAPQDDSGEIDMMENCSGSLNLSFGSDPHNYGPWPGKNADNLPPHEVTLTFQENGDVTSKMCPLAGGDCVAGPTRTGYRQATSKNWNGKNFSIVSDVWNGTGGDAGYAACAKHSTPDTNCAYKVSNIKFTPQTGPVFTGACSSLNA